MAKATTIKEALARWEEKTSQKPSEAKEIKLYAQIPPIEKMDASLSMLANCEKLSLSTNCIEKIANLNGLIGKAFDSLSEFPMTAETWRLKTTEVPSQFWRSKV
uniref:Dynein axonemal light chain 1 n=1 Tax=Rousettus aegyptiacus TaxID=9407 RepID=A0A7J8IIS9_ROUAE|nr:dynein axonemal light chain 1 [Rousettus aegyptiacus]